VRSRDSLPQKMKVHRTIRLLVGHTSASQPEEQFWQQQKRPPGGRFRRPQHSRGDSENGAVPDRAYAR
jgi:hypothetical protein